MSTSTAHGCLSLDSHELNDRKELELLRAKVERSERELGEFAVVASHDLLEPLRKVTSYCQLLKEEQGDRLDDEGRLFLDVAIDGADRMKVLVRDLFVYARVTSREKSSGPSPADEALQEAVENLEGVIEETGAELEIEPLPQVVSEHSLLVRLFESLLSNALKYCTATPPRIRVGWREANGFCEISVSDNGIGIAEEQHEAIFQAFNRLHNRQEYSGAGMGLAICRRIVENAGGRIWVESTPGVGSTFYFTLRQPSDC